MDKEKLKTYSQRIMQIEKEIQTLKAQWPAHSVKAGMLQQLEDLEEELVQLRHKIGQRDENDATAK